MSDAICDATDSAVSTVRVLAPVSPATFFSNSSLLAASTRELPLAPSSLARAAPIPLLAPVITTTFDSTCESAAKETGVR
jgi:hypothetical protein